MYSERFLLISEKMHNKISLLEIGSQEYITEVENFYSILESLEPKSLDFFLRQSGLKKEFDIWRRYSKEIFKLIEEYKIIPEKNVIRIKINEEFEEKSLLDIKEYMNTLNIKKETWEENLVLSFFLNPQNYEFFQLVNSFLKKS